jgi:hypothetical protein
MDNSTTSSIINHTVKQQESQAEEMIFYWIQDQSDQNQFHVYWTPGYINLGDYFTKYHAVAHHRHVRQ